MRIIYARAVVTTAMSAMTMMILMFCCGGPQGKGTISIQPWTIYMQMERECSTRAQPHSG